MEISKHKDIKFELVSEDGLSTYVIPKKRILVGSGESCDLALIGESIEGVHAVVEVLSNCLRVYDMNTLEGSFVNGQSAIAKDAYPGDQICFGKICFSVDFFDATSAIADNNVPPILIEDLDSGVSSVVPISPKRINKIDKPVIKKGSYDKVEYPLENYPNANKLEYIFELPESIKNVLHYDMYEKAIEITITNGNRVFSIDYLDASSADFYLSGNIHQQGVVLPFLAKNEKISFLENRQGHYFIKKIDGFEFLNLGDTENKDLLSNDSLCVFISDQVKVFFRLSEAPPRTLIEPFLENDKVFWKYFSAVIGLVVVFLMFIGVMDVNEELKEKKAPEKLASVLYKKPVLSIAVEKTKNANKKVAQKAKKPPRKVKAKVVKNKTFRKKQKSKSIARKRSKKTSAPKVVMKKSSASKTKAKGSIDTYKAVDFSASLPNVLSKSSDISKVSNEQQKSFEYTSESPAAKNIGDDIKLNQVSDTADDISKNASKDISDTGSLSEFQSNKVMATAGIPSRTVVLGGMDPDTIRKILMDHLPQFRFCYQKELDKSSKEFSGKITLNFVIGASGYVTRAGVKESSMPQDVKGCVVNVLKGIPFPAPRGGGVVEVTQPMNFYPKE